MSNSGNRRSMDEVLSSIRRIIRSEKGEEAEPAPAPQQADPLKLTPGMQSGAEPLHPTPVATPEPLRPAPMGANAPLRPTPAARPEPLRPEPVMAPADDEAGMPPLASRAEPEPDEDDDDTSIFDSLPHEEDEDIAEIDEQELAEMIRQIIREEMDGEIRALARQVLAEAMETELREMAREVVHEEMTGTLGRRISDNVTRMIGAEVKRLLSERG